MKLPLINHDDAVHSLEILKKYYDHKMIPAEKKPYLSLLENSHGPYMGLLGSDGKTHFMLDAASQIAPSLNRLTLEKRFPSGTKRFVSLTKKVPKKVPGTFSLHQNRPKT